MAEQVPSLGVLLTAEEVSEQLRVVTPRHLREAAKSGLLRSVVIGVGTQRPRRLYKPEDVAQWLESRSVGGPAPAPVKPPRKRPAAASATRWSA